MDEFFRSAAQQTHPIRKLLDFLEREKQNEIAKHYNDLRFVGYVLDIGYDTATVITSDPFKIAVGGLPRNSFLIMTPRYLNGDGKIIPHFTLLRVKEAAPTPLSNETQQTFFELHKRSMPEIDTFTQSELQWGALKCSVLGMFYPDPDRRDQIEFSGDVNNIASPYKYFVYAPDDAMLDLIVNSMVPIEMRFDLGHLRPTECRLSATGRAGPNVAANVSAKDFIGTRTALFGKTRLGKSNVVKLLVESVIRETAKDKNVGQLIFDINGEYANDNPQDNNTSLKSVYATDCEVYALVAKASTPSHPLKLNFYENPSSTLPVLKQLLATDGQTADYVTGFTSVSLPKIEDIPGLPSVGDKVRALRKIQMYWAILHAAGFRADETALRQKLSGIQGMSMRGFDPHFNKEVREFVYGQGKEPPAPTSLTELQAEIQAVAKRYEEDTGNTVFNGKSKLFDSDDQLLLRFVAPNPGRSGPAKLAKYRPYHDPKATDFMTEIIGFLTAGKTVILDLGNASEELVKYFSDTLSRQVFAVQQDRFANNALNDKYVQIYFEEAHNVFPLKADPTTIYARLAKEGAKFHIGIVYSTQSPSTIYDELLAQTENFFVGHLSSDKEAKMIGKLHIAFAGLDAEIMQTRQPGYMRMLTRSHRFAIPVQARLFKPQSP